MPAIQKISPCLWFDGKAEEAAKFYVSLFPGSRVVDVARYSEAGPGTPGNVMMVRFELAGQTFQALNGGPQYRFTEAISMSVDCADQAEVDHLWEKLGEGGSHVACGWLKDRYGLSWQIVPRGFIDLVGGPDRAGAARAMQAMRKMVKLDLPALQKAYRGD